jgi:hypothetical protein
MWHSFVLLKGNFCLWKSNDKIDLKVKPKYCWISSSSLFFITINPIICYWGKKHLYVFEIFEIAMSRTSLLARSQTKLKGWDNII